MVVNDEQLLEELTDLVVLPEVQAIDPGVVMIIKNNTKLVGKVKDDDNGDDDNRQSKYTAHHLLSCILFANYLASSSGKSIDRHTGITPTLLNFASRCQVILLRMLRVSPCVEELKSIEVIDGGNTISLLSYLLQTYFMYPDNQSNEELLQELMSAHAMIGNAVVESDSSSGKYLMQV